MLNANIGLVGEATSAVTGANRDTAAVDRCLAFTDPQSDAAINQQAEENGAILRNRRTAAFEAVRQSVVDRQQQNIIEFGQRGAVQQGWRRSASGFSKTH